MSSISVVCPKCEHRIRLAWVEPDMEVVQVECTECHTVFEIDFTTDE